ncbi:MAG: permease-like cell division protein FtsX [Candidatus Taylorbacteria bacterium]|nr:permease-like cell division protein FtsX [Candidatus Taylorbacteria bacterium]
MWTSFKRVTRAGFVSFWRNGFLSFSFILSITIALCVISAVLLFNIISNNYISQIKEKVDVNVYFAPDVVETDVLGLKKMIEALPEVSRVDYISRDQVLADFKNKNQDNAVILQGLDEVGNNPFSAVLNIKAKEPQQYDGIAKFLESKNALSKDGSSIIESVNYNKNKDVISKLSQIIQVTEGVGVGISVLLGLAIIIITLNTMRLIIYSAKDEISVMKLVGASNMHVRGPFVVSGVMCGVTSAVLTALIMYPATYYFGKILKIISSDFSLNAYYLTHIGEIFIILLVVGVVLGAVSSYISVRRYLNV